MKSPLRISALPLIILFFLAGSINPADSGTTGTDADTVVRTEYEIRQVWELLKPDYSSSAFREVPLVSAGYRPGSLSSGFVEDGIRMTNFVRYLAGLPGNVRADQDLMEQAQYGAVLLAASEEFAHELPRPEGMSDKTYQRGYASTTTSNIARGYGTLEAAIQHGYMRDDDLYNLPTLGHRRWILNPVFTRTGFGFAEGFMYGKYRVGNSTMQVHNQTGVEPDYQFTAWPAAGAFPREFFDSDDPWSVTLNPALFAEPDPAAVSVVLTRLIDGKQWTLDSADNVLNLEGEYFNVNNERYGVPNVIIFRPVPGDVSSAEEVNIMGDRPIVRTPFHVEIRGIRTVDGVESSIEYSVSFFDLEEDISRFAVFR